MEFLVIILILAVFIGLLFLVINVNHSANKKRDLDDDDDLMMYMLIDDDDDYMDDDEWN